MSTYAIATEIRLPNLRYLQLNLWLGPPNRKWMGGLSSAGRAAAPTDPPPPPFLVPIAVVS